MALDHGQAQTLNMSMMGFSVTTEMTNVSVGEEDEYTPLVSYFVRWIMTIVNYTILGALVNLFGCGANTINIIVFVKMGFSETINISLFGLAISDLLCLVTLQWLNVCKTPWFQYSDIPFESFEIQYLTAGLHHICMTRVTARITAYVALERCLCVIIPPKVKVILTLTKTKAIIIGIFALVITCTVPFYAVNTFGPKWYPDRNRTLIGIVFLDNKVIVEQVAFAVSNFSNFVAFIVVIMCTKILINTLKSKAEWREGSRVPGSGGQPISNAKSKDRRVIIMVTSLSAIFLICNFPITVVFIGTMVEPELSLIGRYQNLVHSLYPIVLLFETLNSSVNIFIYMRMSSKYRSTFKVLIGKEIKKK